MNIWLNCIQISEVKNVPRKFLRVMSAVMSDEVRRLVWANTGRNTSIVPSLHCIQYPAYQSPSDQAEKLTWYGHRSDCPMHAMVV